MGSLFVSWIDLFAIECPKQPPKKAPADALKSSLAQKGAMVNKLT